MSRIGIGLCVIIGCFSWAKESPFLIKGSRAAKKTIMQERTDTIEKTGELIECISKEIERLAHLQKKLCAELRNALNGSKTSIIAKASRQDLQNFRGELSDKYQTSEKERVACDRCLELFKP